jgi:hypothetical protein
VSHPSSFESLRAAAALALTLERGRSLSWDDLGDFNEIAASYGLNEAQRALVSHLASLVAKFDAGELKPGELVAFARSLAGRDP